MEEYMNESKRKALIALLKEAVQDELSPQSIRNLKMLPAKRNAQRQSSKVRRARRRVCPYPAAAVEMKPDYNLYQYPTAAIAKNQATWGFCCSSILPLN
jgi:hypothetical protein